MEDLALPLFFAIWKAHAEAHAPNMQNMHIKQICRRLISNECLQVKDRFNTSRCQMGAGMWSPGIWDKLPQTQAPAHSRHITLKHVPGSVNEVMQE